MNEIVFAGPIPTNIRSKAETLIQDGAICLGGGWRKISGLKGSLSYRLNRNYRAIAIKSGAFFVSNHDIYSKKIKYLRKVEA